MILLYGELAMKLDALFALEDWSGRRLAEALDVSDAAVSRWRLELQTMTLERACETELATQGLVRVEDLPLDPKTAAVYRRIKAAIIRSKRAK